jgi:hypothetical protein
VSLLLAFQGAPTAPDLIFVPVEEVFDWDQDEVEWLVDLPSDDVVTFVWAVDVDEGEDESDSVDLLLSIDLVFPYLSLSDEEDDSDDFIDILSPLFDAPTPLDPYEVFLPIDLSDWDDGEDDQETEIIVMGVFDEPTVSTAFTIFIPTYRPRRR